MYGLKFFAPFARFCTVLQLFFSSVHLYSFFALFCATKRHSYRPYIYVRLEE